MFSKKIPIILVSTILICSLISGCKKDNDHNQTPKGKSSVGISGSTSVGPIVEKEAEFFKEKNKNINIEVNQLGSSAGIKDTINGTVEIGMSSRDLKEEEKKSGIKEVEIAFDGIGVIANRSNKIKSLTIEEIKDIYTGKIKNWKDVGGQDRPIVVVSREDGSGTRDAFQEIVGYKAEELIKNALIGDGSGNIKSTVKTNENAIGYISFEYIDNTINALAVENISPTPENVLNKTYKISRPFLLVYKEENQSNNSKKFIDFILSKEGQKVVEDNGLIKIK